MTDQKHILVVDDHPLMCHAISTTVSALYPDIGTHTATTAAAARAILRQPDLTWTLVLCDLSLPDVDGLELVKEIRQTMSIPVIVLTGQNDPITMQAAKASGATGYVTKSASTEALSSALAAVIEGGNYFAAVPPLSSQLVQKELTERQKQVLDLVMLGRPNKAIAEQLCLGEGTVRNLVSGLFDLFDITTRSRSALILQVTNMGYKARSKPT